MSEIPEPATKRLAQTTPTQPPRQRGGFLRRLLAAFLVLLITTFLALAGVAVALYALGATPDMPRQLADTRAQLATSAALNAALQTQVSELSRRSDAINETVGDLQRQMT